MKKHHHSINTYPRVTSKIRSIAIQTDSIFTRDLTAHLQPANKYMSDVKCEMSINELSPYESIHQSISVFIRHPKEKNLVPGFLIRSCISYTLRCKNG
jgi:hypothetical protein